jgi:flavin reductase (DIM6/NTAB) family NADH-FMN oxidoreductase RutF
VAILAEHDEAEALRLLPCVIDQTIDAGGHTIVLVTAIRVAINPGAPLVAYDRALRTLLA